MKHGHADRKWVWNQLSSSTLLLSPIIHVTNDLHWNNQAKLHPPFLGKISKTLTILLVDATYILPLFHLWTSYRNFENISLLGILWRSPICFHIACIFITSKVMSNNVTVVSECHKIIPLQYKCQLCSIAKWTPARRYVMSYALK